MACGKYSDTQTTLSKIDFWFPECCKAGESCETATGMERTALHHNSLFRQVFYLRPQQATELLYYCHVHSIETTASVQHLQVSGTGLKRSQLHASLTLLPLFHMLAMECVHCLSISCDCIPFKLENHCALKKKNQQEMSLLKTRVIYTLTYISCASVRTCGSLHSLFLLSSFLLLPSLPFSFSSHPPGKRTMSTRLWPTLGDTLNSILHTSSLSWLTLMKMAWMHSNRCRIGGNEKRGWRKQREVGMEDERLERERERMMEWAILVCSNQNHDFVVIFLPLDASHHCSYLLPFSSFWKTQARRQI